MLLNFLSEKLIDKEDHRVAERTFIHIMIQRLFHFVFIFFFLFFNLQTDLLKKRYFQLCLHYTDVNLFSFWSDQIDTGGTIMYSVEINKECYKVWWKKNYLFFLEMEIGKFYMCLRNVYGRALFLNDFLNNIHQCHSHNSLGHLGS